MTGEDFFDGRKLILNGFQEAVIYSSETVIPEFERSEMDTER